MVIEDRDVMRLAAHIKANFGVNLEKKATLIKSRLVNVLEKKNVSDFSKYVDHALKDEGEISFLLTRLTTNYSYFMREEQHFRFMKNTLLPKLESTIRDNDLRIWSAGCSSGEEPYTIAMVLDEHFESRGRMWDKKVLATDISQKVLTEAVTGIYPEERLSNVPDTWKRRYFTKVAQGYQVSDAMKQEVIFRIFNLMTPTFPFRRKFHVIFCRNVMIYFDKETKLALMHKYCDHLEIGGHLIIGVSEPMGQFDRRLTTVVPSIYRKDYN